jgi:hypothetical protein
MEPRTDEVSTKDWLEASRDIVIRAYIENRTSYLTLLREPISLGNASQSHAEVSMPLTKQQPTVSGDLASELHVWDTLSDEALKNFEQELD